MGDDNLYDAFVLEAERLANEAKKNGDDEAHAVHSGWRLFWEGQRKESRERPSVVPSRGDVPQNSKLIDELREESRHEMGLHVHIYRGNDILCRELIFRKDEFKSVPFKPDMQVDRFHKAFRNTSYYQTFRTDLCPACIIEAKMIRSGVIG